MYNCTITLSMQLLYYLAINAYKLAVLTLNAHNYPPLSSVGDIIISNIKLWVGYINPTLRALLVC